MRLKKKTFSINFWVGVTIVIALLWYLMFTPHGAIRRELIGKQWLGAVGAKIEEIKPDQRKSFTVYTTNPKLKNEHGKTFYFTCYKKNIYLKCHEIDY